MITKDAKTTKGFFTVHQIKDRYYYEIPKAEPGRELLLNIRIAKTTAGVGYGGEDLADRVVKWELKGNKVKPARRQFQRHSRPKMPISLAVHAANNETILMTFPVAAFSKEGAPVIEISRLYTSDVPEFSVRQSQHLNATLADVTRSYIERPYPENVEAESTLTYTRAQHPLGGAAACAPAAPAW